MNAEQYLLAAISALTGCTVFLFMQWRTIALECEIERKECQRKYEDLLVRISKLELTALKRESDRPT